MQSTQTATRKTRSTRAVGVMAMAIVGMVAGAARPAHSFVHPLNAFLNYFQPDGERTANDWIRGCIVETGLFTSPTGDQAVLRTISGTYRKLASHCAPFEGYITIVTFDGSRLKDGLTGVTNRVVGVTGYPHARDNYTYYEALSRGEPGDAVLGAHVCATNTNALITCWDITAF